MIFVHILGPKKLLAQPNPMNANEIPIITPSIFIQIRQKSCSNEI